MFRLLIHSKLSLDNRGSAFLLDLFLSRSYHELFLLQLEELWVEVAGGDRIDLIILDYNSVQYFVVKTMEEFAFDKPYVS